MLKSSIICKVLLARHYLQGNIIQRNGVGGFMAGIIVIGSLNMDLVINAPRMPVIGESIIGGGFITAPGGKGANQAVAAARLGGQVTMVGCLGNDVFGSSLLKNLKDNNINIENVKILEGVSTGIAVIVLVSGDNFIVVDPGANAMLTPEHIESLDEQIGRSDIMLVQLEIPIETVERAITMAKRHGVKVLLNPAPARSLPDSLLSKVDIFTPNESECGIVTGIQAESVDSASMAVKYLLGKGIPQVVITMGAKGVVYNKGSNIIHKPAYRVNVVDTTAAGDSFSGALSVALSQGKGIDEAVDFASAVGALTVTKKGAQPSLPTLEEVNAFLSECDSHNLNPPFDFIRHQEY